VAGIFIVLRPIPATTTSGGGGGERGRQGRTVASAGQWERGRGV
jgi:hypothetical protein